MNETSRLQFPTWSQINREQRRRERFKRAVIVSAAAFTLLLVGLLILGIKTKLAARQAGPTAELRTPPVTTTAPATVPDSSQPASAVSREAATLYVVKAGDALSGIAKAYGTTIEAIKTANGLTSDRILAGEKLKIPGAASPH